jgi:hypothetical protein
MCSWPTSIPHSPDLGKGQEDGEELPEEANTVGAGEEFSSPHHGKMLREPALPPLQ